MKAFINSIVAVFNEDKPAKVTMTMAERKRAANAALDRALLRNHGERGSAVLTKLKVAEKLRKDLAESCAKHSDAMLTMVERSIRSFERVGA